MEPGPLLHFSFTLCCLAMPFGGSITPKRSSPSRGSTMN